jgi:hypothetical protein
MTAFNNLFGKINVMMNNQAATITIIEPLELYNSLPILNMDQNRQNDAEEFFTKVIEYIEPNIKSRFEGKTTCRKTCFNCNFQTLLNVETFPSLLIVLPTTSTTKHIALQKLVDDHFAPHEIDTSQEVQGECYTCFGCNNNLTYKVGNNNNNTTTY